MRQQHILIYTTGAYVGRTGCYLGTEDAVASNYVNILRIRHLNPVFLLVFLNSIPGHTQVVRHLRGSAQAELYPRDIAEFHVWDASPEIQGEVASLVKESHELRAKGNHLVKTAIAKIDDAIGP